MKKVKVDGASDTLASDVVVCDTHAGGGNGSASGL